MAHPVAAAEFIVLLDTGSSDLYLNTTGRNVRYTNTTDVVAVEKYGKGSATGNIAFAELRLGPYVIPSQAFLDITESEDSSHDGIMGVAFDVASIYENLTLAWGSEAAFELGKSPMTNLFALEPSLPNFFDVHLGRADPSSPNGQTGDGLFSISVHKPGYEAVTSAPKLSRVTPEHWSVLLDSMQINGQPFTFNQSSVEGVPAGKTVAVLDTGFSLPGLPPAAADAIYSTIPGALWSESEGYYVVPCNSSANLSFTLGGVEYPVHPLDVSLINVVEAVVNGTDMNFAFCFGAFTRLSLPPVGFTGFDMILGAAFLRNVYATFDYGDFDPITNTESTPFVQMLSTVTDLSAAWGEFYASRARASASGITILDPEDYLNNFANAGSSAGSGSDSTDSAQPDADVSVSGASSTDDSDDAHKSDTGKYGLAAVGLLGANLAIGIVLLGITLTMCLRGGMKGKSAGGPRYTPVKFKEPADNDPEAAHLRYGD
ncbi:acid protease [Trametes cingulata]|nr:acid protease [Trametes cingulata]